MATFDQLSPEQRAIIELVLKQGQSYEELSELLGLSTSRVRELAREALMRLSPVSAAAVAEDWRGRLGDYLLGQLGEPDATSTRGHLARSEAARGWARSVLDSLEQFYDDESLPTVPEPEPAPAPTPAPVREGPSMAPADPGAQALVRQRRLVGVGAAATLLVLLMVLVWPIGVGPLALGGDDDDAGEKAGGGEEGSAAGGTRVLGALPLQPVESLEGSREVQGVAAIVERGGDRVLVVNARGLPRTRRGEAFEVWLYNSDGDAKSMGAQVTDAQGGFEGSNELPADFERYRFIDISREAVPRTEEQIRAEEGHSGKSLLRGALAQLAPVSENAQDDAPPD